MNDSGLTGISMYLVWLISLYFSMHTNSEYSLFLALILVIEFVFPKMWDM